MVTLKKAIKIVLEGDAEKRNKLIDKLSEEDAKQMLKVILKTVIEKNDNPFSEKKTDEE